MKKNKWIGSDQFLRPEHNSEQYNASLPVNTETRNAVDIQKEVTCSLIEVKKEYKSPIVASNVPNFFGVHKNKKIKTKDNNQDFVDAPANVHKTNKIKHKDTNQN